METITETFVANDPKGAYEQAIAKYGKAPKLLSARQVKDEEGRLRCEVRFEVPKALFEQQTGVSQEEGEDIEALLEEVATLKSQLKRLQSIDEKQDAREEVVALFTQKGLDGDWVKARLEALQESALYNDKKLLVSYLLEEIDEALQIKTERFDRAKILFLVGPTGVGKTTTIAKLAARYSLLLPRKLNVLLINLDSYKVGAVEQLQHYAQIMNLEQIAVRTPRAYLDAVRSLEGYDVVLVDTAGMSPYDMHKFVKTVEFLRVSEQFEHEILLTLSASVKQADMEDIYESFSFLGVDGLVVTKFDETKHYGNIINFALRYDLPFAYFSTGQEVPDDLLVADKEFLLSRFVGEFERE